ncbi:MAG: helix-turn-helix domain-containing protein [Dorea sp.]|nr:helix-turn-helix domain-containing protein [Dorea sp.]
MDSQLIFDSLWSIMNTLLLLALIAGGIFIFLLIVKALKKYLASGPVRKEKKETIANLGEVIKEYRTANKMTQEFVAESIGVSRQAVSKWESGKSDPSTSNLISLAKLFRIEPEELLKCLK